MKNYYMQYPFDNGNANYDGRRHSITPRELKVININGLLLYHLSYFDNDLRKNMFTILVKNGSSFIKVPLKNYNSPKLMLATALGIKRSLDELPEEIGCYDRIVSIEEIDDVVARVNAASPAKTATAVAPPPPVQTAVAPPPPPPGEPGGPNGPGGPTAVAPPPSPPGGPGGPNGPGGPVNVLVAGAFPPPNGHNDPEPIKPIKPDLRGKIERIYYNRFNGMYYWDKNCIDLITGPLMIDLLEHDSKPSRGQSICLVQGVDLCYIVNIVNKEPAKPKEVILYQYQGNYFWDAECQLQYVDENNVLKLAGVDVDVVNLDNQIEFSINPVFAHQLVKGPEMQEITLMPGLKVEFVGHLYYNQEDGLFYWDRHCLDMVTGPLLMNLINSNAKNDVEDGKKAGILFDRTYYSIEPVSKKEIRRINPVYLFMKDGIHYWDPNCTIPLRKGNNGFGSYNVHAQVTVVQEQREEDETIPLFYNDYDGMCYRDSSCTICLGKIDDVGTIDPLTRIVTSYVGLKYYLLRVNVKTDELSNSLGPRF